MRKKKSEERMSRYAKIAETFFTTSFFWDGMGWERGRGGGMEIGQVR